MPAPQEQDLIYGTHAVAAALTNPRRHIRHIWATRNAASRLSETVDGCDLDVEIVQPAASEKILGDKVVHQGIALEAAPLRPPHIEDLPVTGRYAA